MRIVYSSSINKQIANKMAINLQKSNNNQSLSQLASAINRYARRLNYIHTKLIDS